MKDAVLKDFPKCGVEPVRILVCMASDTQRDFDISMSLHGRDAYFCRVCGKWGPHEWMLVHEICDGAVTQPEKRGTFS